MTRGWVVPRERPDLLRGEREPVRDEAASPRHWSPAADPHGVHQHELAQAVTAAHGHLRRDPAAQRVADEAEVVEPKRVDEVKAKVGEILDGFEPGRPRRARVPRE